MSGRRVVLLCERQLLGESLEHVLRHMGEVELYGPWDYGESTFSRLEEVHPQLVVIADNFPARSPQCARTACMTAQVLEAFPAIPVVRVGLAQNLVQVYTSRTLAANSSELNRILDQIETD